MPANTSLWQAVLDVARGNVTPDFLHRALLVVFILGGLAVGIAGLLALHQFTNTGMRRRLMVVLTFLAGLFYVLEFALPPGAGMSTRMRADDVRDPAKLAVTLRDGGNALSSYLFSQLSGDTQRLAREADPAKDTDPKLAEGLATDLNRVLDAGLLYDERRFAGIELSKGIMTWIGRNPQGPGLYQLNRALVQEAYARELPRSKDNFLSPWVEVIGSIVIVIGGFAFGLGLLNLATIHGRTILRARSGWPESLAFFIAMILMAVSGLFKGDAGFLKSMNDILFQGLFQPLGASVFSILAFFITTAAYRAFRVRSGEATLMMIAAFLVMMAQVPMGMLLTSWLPETGWVSYFRIENISNWIMTVLNMAALRAVGFGIGVGALAMSLRVWLSLEKGTYFGKEM